MGCINFEDRALIKRQRAGKKRNVTDVGKEDIIDAEVHPFIEVQEMTKTQLRCKSQMLQQRKDTPSWTKLHFWRKVFAFQILSNSCGYK